MVFPSCRALTVLRFAAPAMMLNSRITTSAGGAVAGPCIGMGSTFLVSACGSEPSMPAQSAPPSTNPSGVYGDPAAAAKYWQEQSLEDNCGLVSVADVVGESRPRRRAGHCRRLHECLANRRGVDRRYRVSQLSTTPGAAYWLLTTDGRRRNRRRLEVWLRCRCGCRACFATR